MLPRRPHQAPHEQARAGRLISIGGPGQEFDCCIQVDFLECDIVDGFTGDAITDQKDGLRCHGSGAQRSTFCMCQYGRLHIFKNNPCAPALLSLILPGSRDSVGHDGEGLFSK